MKKKVIIGVVFFLVGLGLSLVSESFLRTSVFDLYKWTTNDKIQFIGKAVFFFSPFIYYFGFGITLLIMSIDALSQSISQNILMIISSVTIFTLILIGISALNANIKLFECTMCHDGIRQIVYREVNYGLINGVSLILSGAPSWIRVIFRKKNVQHSV